MKALIKYLPTNIPPQPGDIILYQGIFSEFSDKTIYNFNYQMVKPFVVTRDVEVGDELTAIEDGTKVIIKTVSQLEYYDGDSWVKILGEVSPEATFVEDGKEHEVRTYTKEDVENLRGFFCRKVGEVIISVNNQIKIKCPCCGTFK